MKRIFQIYKDWFFLFVYLGAIFFMLPFSVYSVESFVETNPFFSAPISFLVYGTVITVTIALVIYVVFTEKEFKAIRLFVLAVILLIALYFLSEIESSHDKLHIIEYSILSFLLFRVLRFYNPTTALYFWCVIFIVIAGATDEYVQSLFPVKDFSMLDLKTDITAGILSQLTIALVIRPRLEKWRIKMSFFKKRLDQREKWIKDYKMKQDVRLP